MADLTEPETIAAGKRRSRSLLRELPVMLVIALVLALLIKSFLAQAFFIPSESMQPTLNPGDRVLVNRAVYRLHPPRRQDVIVFADPRARPPGGLSGLWHWVTQGLGATTSPDKDFIKRVIGLPGETVEIHGGVVSVDGKALSEPYLLAPDARDIPDFGPIEIPAGELFVLGDNRAHSGDSRFSPPSGFGLVPENKVIGRAFVIVWPPSEWSGLRG